jgi:ubiquinone/menaquinone biosynthesis C-methylase UbiE
MINDSKSKIDMDASSLVDRDLSYWNRVADDYEQSLVDPNFAEEASVLYEEFEDEYIDKVIERNKLKKLVLIEIGSGTGRYQRKYAEDLRIQYIIGIDFSSNMIKCSLKNLEEYKEDIGKRILLVQGLAEKTSVLVNSIEKLKDTMPIVTCVFNTLGNIESEERRLEVLKRIKEMLGERGIGIISVFNRKAMYPNKKSLKSDCERYYIDDRIEKLIVPPFLRERIKMYGRKIKKTLDPVTIDPEKGDIRTEDFYSHWFEEKEFVKLLQKANLKIIAIEVGNKIKNYKAKRGIIGKVVNG